MAPGEDPHKFHGVQADIESMGDFIRLFTTREGRWQSPKYLIGESYGTTRAAGLAGYLRSAHQMYLNGVILVSTTGLSYDSGTDMRFVTSLPYLHTLILGGYFDGGTDFSTAHYTISHLDPSGALNRRFHFAFFESGHMLYLKDSVRAQAKQELVKFIQTTEAAVAAATGQ